MDDSTRGQVNRSAADVYEAFFVPALFGAWAAPVAAAAGVTSGQEVLDVACGTGVLTREVAGRVQPGGAVIGLDRNPGMLAVARRVAPEIRFETGLAEQLPFADRAFDAVVSQFGLMFFENRVAALREMWRVVRPDGRVAVAVWDDVERSPGYAAMLALLKRLFGDRVADALRAPFALGDKEAFGSLLAEAGITDAAVQTQLGTARFPSIEAWVHTDVKGWTLADLIDDGQYAALQQAAQTEFQRFVQADGTVAFPAPAHIGTATRR